MADSAERWAGRWYRNKPQPALLVLAGHSGTAKSHTALRLWDYCERAAYNSFEAGSWVNPLHVPSILFLRWPEVCTGFDANEYGALNDAMESDCLFIDDIGSENDPWKKHADKLCQILTRRERKFTAVTTNVGAANWSAAFDKRIADRLLRNSDVVELRETKSYCV